MTANTSLKTSLLVNRQVPEFVRDEYPTFVTFLEAYYEFLEQKQGTQKNDLTNVAKSLKTLKDVDDSIDDFEQSFYNTYASLIPLEVQANKALLFKHLVNLYGTKGSENSFKLLFRLVFGEDIDILYPKNSVFRASASNWIVDNKLRIKAEVYSRYVGDGNTKTFFLAQKAGEEDTQIFVNGVIQQTSYKLLKEYRRLVFDTAPPNGAIIQVYYDKFNAELFNNRRVTGLTSGAYALIENSNRRIISDALNIGLPIELLISPKSLEGSFLNGEEISIPIIDDRGNTIDCRAVAFSTIRRINIKNGGTNYNIGETILVTGGNASVNAIAEVATIFEGVITRVLVRHGGATFTNLSNVDVVGSNNFGLSAFVDGIDLSGANAPNSVIVNTDVISNIANVYIGYGVGQANITILNGGGNYTNGYIIFSGGGSQNVSAQATVEVFESNGAIYSINVTSSGSYSDPGSITATLNSAGNGGVSLSVVGFRDYGFPRGLITTSENVTTNIADVLTFETLQAGPITNVKVIFSNTALDFSPVLDAFGAFYNPLEASAGSARTTRSIGSIARFRINEGGIGYGVGDEIEFGPPPLGTYGQGAAAVIGQVDANGTIQRIDIANSRITGTVSTTASSEVVLGSGTFFTRDIKVGDLIDVNGESRIVDVITNDTTLSALTDFNKTSVNQRMGLFGRYPIGGYGYTQNNFPTIKVTASSGGIGANIQIDAIASDNEQLQGTGDDNPGAITSIRILEYGDGYEYIPKVTVVSSNGIGAILEADIERSYSISPGRWTTSDSILSSDERKIQGEDYYTDYSYVVSSQKEFFKYKKMLKELLHPVGFVEYAEYRIQNNITTNTITISTGTNQETGVGPGSNIRTISGRVNVTNGNIVVTGVNTKFNVANTNYIVRPNYRIAVNGDIRTINTIVNNTTIVISENISEIIVANTGNGYSNGYLSFTGGSATVTEVTIANVVTDVVANAGAVGVNSFIQFSGGGTPNIPANAYMYVNTAGYIENVTVLSVGAYPLSTVTATANQGTASLTLNVLAGGSGYSNGSVIFDSGEEIIDAVATVEVYPSNGTIRSVTLTSGGLYSYAPEARISTTPARTIQNNTITINNAGAGYTDGYFSFLGGNPIRVANAGYEVYSTNGAIKSVTVYDSGLYESDPLIVPNTSPNVVVWRVNVVDSGLGHPNSSLVITGDNSRQAQIEVETYPWGAAQVASITANAGSITTNGYITFAPIITEIPGIDTVPEYIQANARIYVDTTGHIVNVTVIRPGLYGVFPVGNTPIATANSGNAVFTVNIESISGKIRRTRIIDSGLYSNTGSAPTAILNTQPRSVVSITSNSATYNGISLANGTLVFSNGNASIEAVGTYEVFNSNGVIRSITITHEGLYRTTPNVRPNVTPVSITEAFPIIGGSDYSNGFIVFSTSQETGNIAANVAVNVNSTGAIVSSVVNHAGLYANGADIIIVGILGDGDALQTPTTQASFRLGYNANTRNVANLIVTTTANGFYTASVTLSANSNTVTNASITVQGVANNQTIAVLNVKVAGKNTMANAYVTVDSNGKVQNVNILSPGNYYYPPNVSFDTGGTGAVFVINTTSMFKQSANLQEAIIYP